MNNKKKVTSVNNLVLLLSDIQTSPEKFISDEILINALRSQGELAKYSNPEKQIYGVSLNTLKSVGDKHLLNGFESLDIARKKSLQKINSLKNKNNNSYYKSRKQLDEENKFLKKSIKDLEAENMILTTLVNLMKGKLKENAKSKVAISDYEDTSKKLEAILSYHSITLEEVNEKF